jgi:polyketide cyclase/dehydrase/lipid transport protein
VSDATYGIGFSGLGDSSRRHRAGICHRGQAADGSSWRFPGALAAGEFCAIKDWHPLVAGCEETKEGADTFRILTLKDGGKIKEKLTDQDDTSYSYEIVESPLPVKNYKAKFWVEPDDEPERTAVYWEAEFDANGASDDEARKKVFDVMVAGMKGIKQLALQKNPGASDHD